MRNVGSVRSCVAGCAIDSRSGSDRISTKQRSDGTRAGRAAGRLAFAACSSGKDLVSELLRLECAKRQVSLSFVRFTTMLGIVSFVTAENGPFKDSPSRLVLLWQFQA